MEEGKAYTTIFWITFYTFLYPFFHTSFEYMCIYLYSYIRLYIRFLKIDTVTVKPLLLTYWQTFIFIHSHSLPVSKQYPIEQFPNSSPTVSQQYPVYQFPSSFLTISRFNLFFFWYFGQYGQCLHLLPQHWPSLNKASSVRMVRPSSSW